MKTFSYLQKKNPHQKSMNETNYLEADKDLLPRFLIVARKRKVDLGENLTFLSQFPSNRSNSDGSLLNSQKAALFHYLQATFSDTKIIKSSQNSALILNNMAIIINWLIMFEQRL